MSIDETFFLTKLPPAWFFWKLARYRVDIELGKVFNHRNEEVCTLNGKPGDERYVMTLQYRGLRRTVKRYQIVWWKATGFWPLYGLDHKNDIKTDDRYENLQELSQTSNMIKTLGRTKIRVIPPTEFTARTKVDIQQETFNWMKSLIDIGEAERGR